MKSKAVVLLLVFAIGITTILFLARNGEHPQKHAAKGLDAPAFELKDMEGKIWKMSDLKGKTVLLHFWASW